MANFCPLSKQNPLSVEVNDKRRSREIDPYSSFTRSLGIRYIPKSHWESIAKARNVNGLKREHWKEEQFRMG